VTVKTMLNAKMPIPLLPLYVNGTCDWQTVQSIEAYQQRRLRMAYPSGRIDPGDATHLSLNVADVSEKPTTTGKKYTDSPKEVALEPTQPTPQQVVDLLIEIWPDLSPPGARTLTAQFMTETGGGKACYNWNLGNVKCRSTTPLHMYKPLIWECCTQAEANAFVASGKGRAHIATCDEMQKYDKKWGWRCPKNVMVLFDAPHEECRFYAYASLKEGAERWLKLQKDVIQRNPGYLKLLQAGDAAGAAKALKNAQYYTGDETIYANGMVAQKRIIDATLGPLPPPWK
jgi:hypothetical protein